MNPRPRLSTRLTSALLFLGATGWLTPAVAQLANTTPLPGDMTPAPAIGTQEDPFLVAGNGMYLAVYEDERVLAMPTTGNDPWEAGHTDIYATRIAPDGTVIDTSPIVVDSSPYSQKHPGAVFNGTDWLVAFESRGLHSAGYSTTRDLRAVRVSSAGEVLDSIPIAIDVTDADSFYPTVGSDGVNWVVIWSNLGDLVGCTVDAAGNVGPTVTIEASAWGFDTAIAYAQGRYLLVWEGGIRGRMLDANLNFLSPKLFLSNWADDADPSVATDGQSFFVAWTYLNSYWPVVRGTQVLVDGTITTPGGLELDQGSLEASSGPGVAWNGSHYVVAWMEDVYDWTLNTYEDQVVFNRVDRQGVPIGGPPTEVLASTDFGIWRLRVASLGQGTSYIGWMDLRNGSKREFGGYGTTIDLTGAFAPETAYTIAPPAQLTPDLALGPQGSTLAADVNLAVFVSADAIETRVVYQRIDGEGAVLDPEPVVIASGEDTYSHTAVAWNGDLWLVVWSEAIVGLPTGRIFGARVLPDGTLLDPVPFPILFGHTPDVAALGGDFLVVGSVDNYHESRAIYGRRVRGADGTLLGIGTTFIGSNYALAPSVVSVADRWFVAWHQHPTHDDPSSKMYGAFVLSTGQALPQFAPTYTNLRENSADLVAVGGVVTLAWSDRDQVRVRQILPDGTLLGAPGGTPVVVGDRVTAPTIAWDGGKYVVGAVDYRNQIFLEPELGDLYGSRLTSALLPIEPGGIALRADPRQAEAEAAIAGRDGTSLVLVPAIDTEVGNWRLSISSWSDWKSMGFGLAGTNGVPRLAPVGLVVGDEAVTLSITDALPNTIGYHILGTSALFTPLLGGTLVPSTDSLILVTTDAMGEVHTSIPVPSTLPPGLTVYAQSWFLDPAGPRSASATEGFVNRAP